ncbi:MAG: hypothetical protein A2X18_08650 [Bacteroidetes bacterium GWF2_40_14]|nr:MAG: hypothetical protein A2X18_08650 [Bacteroidetes bacterium GWF2_40_14]
MINIRKLIEEVICDLTYNVSISTVGSKVQVISRLLKNKIFTDWVDSEFVNGYIDDAIIPKHRKSTITGVYADFITPHGFGMMQYKNTEIPIVNLGNEKYEQITEIKVKDSLSVIQSVLENTKDDIAYSLGPNEVYMIQMIMPNCQIMRINKIVSRHFFEAIIQTAKNKLLDIFLEFNDTMFNQEIDFDVMNKKREIDRIINKTINAGVYIEDKGIANICDSTIVGGNRNNIEIYSKAKEELRSITDKIEELVHNIDLDREDLVAEVVKIKMELGSQYQQPKVIKSAFNAIKGIVIGVAANRITPLVDSALEILKQQI